ncbi:hypothetical protein HPB50_022329 [Hyalomma asiaticum]|uniref:Uncharacterized protein n=1 Tax=Hyalomma asiaticum TaxID=266040 RepID=A0ACB7S8Q2_HYAAI|nr:hypothetical protein HPB50_022329 [Hyalomma asiaticum]
MGDYHARELLLVQRIIAFLVICVSGTQDASAERMDLQMRTVQQHVQQCRGRFEWRHGLPSKLVSDRSTTFRSRELRTYLERAGVEHHFASAYHPQANGLTERSNPTPQARLAPYCKNNKPGEADWDDHLEAAAYSINTAVQSSTGSSPYEVVYAQLPRLGATLSLDTPVKVGRSIPRQTLCRNIREDARKRIERAQKVQKRYYDRRRQQAPEYRIGDEVWVQRGAPSSSKKFGAKFEGPFVITERVGENTWRVRSQTFDSRADKRKRNDFPVHVSRLKNCIRRQT